MRVNGDGEIGEKEGEREIISEIQTNT